MSQYQITMKQSSPNRICGCEISRALKEVVVRSAIIDTQWQGLRRRGLARIPLPDPIRQAVVLLARRAEHNCGRMADRAVTGLARLFDGDIHAGERALTDCLKMLRFDKAADREAARLLRATKTRTHMPHGRHQH